jgi:hypothetical protein
MSDRVVIPLPDGRWIALTDEAFRAALAEGAVAAGVNTSPERARSAEAPDYVSAEVAGASARH